MQGGIGLSMIKKIVVLVVCFATLSACVTTTQGGFGKKGSQDEALQVRLDAAKQYIQNGDFEMATRHLRAALEIDDSAPEVHEALGLAFQSSGDIELADTHFKKAVRYGGSSREKMNYAQFLYQQQRFDEAEPLLDTVVNDSLYERRDKGMLLLGLVRQELGKLDEARHVFERSLKLNRNNALAVRQLAIVTFTLRDYKASWSYFQAYRKMVKRIDAEMLLLGIRLADERGDRNAEASYALMLKNLYPDSSEYQSYARQKSRE